MAKAFDWFKQLPLWARGVTIVGGGLAAIYTSYKVYSGIRTAIRNKQASQSIKDVAGERANLEASGVGATFGNSEYQGWASEIQTQFAGCDYSPWSFTVYGLSLSTSGKTLYNILDNFKNDVDFLKLVEAFGIRTYDACGIFNGDVTGVSIYAAVQDELDTNEISTINDLLAKKGIKYKF